MATLSTDTCLKIRDWGSIVTRQFWADRTGCDSCPVLTVEHQRIEVQMSNLGMAGEANNLLRLGVQTISIQEARQSQSQPLYL